MSFRNSQYTVTVISVTDNQPLGFVSMQWSYACIVEHFFSTDAIILKGPDNHTVPVGAIATFHCTAQGEDAYLKINDVAIDELMEGFVFDYEHDCSTSTCNLTMSINAVPQNNNTIIVCVALSDEDPYL